MSEAAQSRQSGARQQEREQYRKAAQAYPTSKEPWLKLAEGYFEAADYGNAILSAQEVLQRDPADRLAGSLLAVSGLRVSASALAALRGQQDLSTDTRRQAEEVVRQVREALGEPMLVAKPADTASATKRPPVRPRVVAPPGAGASAPLAAASSEAGAGRGSVAPVPPPAKRPGTSPFDALR